MSYSLAKEQVGCRLLQSRINENPEIVNKLLFPEVLFIYIDM